MTVVFKNKGLIDLRAVTTMGACIKEGDNPIGFFGTGLKYALAVLLREGCKVTLFRGTQKIEFKLKDRTIRGKKFKMVCMNHVELPYTIEFGKNWELWHAYRELYSNTLDENGTINGGADIGERAYHTTFVVQGAAFDKIHLEAGGIFLQSTPTHILEGLELHDNMGGGKWIYYKGIRVYELPKQAMFDYNITSDIRLTEDRTLASLSHAYIAIAKGVSRCDDPALIRKMLIATQLYWESTIDYNWWQFTPGKCFHEVVQHFIDSGRSINTSAHGLHRSYFPKEPAPEVVIWETIPMAQRRKLWAALLFWQKLDLEIPKAIVHVTEKLGDKKGKVVGGQIYISKFVLEMGMRLVTGLVYKLYAETKPVIGDIKQEALLIDTIVDFGERILGLQKKDKAA